MSHRPVPELEHLIKEEYEEDDVTVKVLELSTENQTRLGVNRPIQSSKDRESDEESEEPEEVPGMELKQKPKIKAKTEAPVLSTKKDIKKLVKKAATKNVKKSKIFQMKNKMESQKMKKKSQHMKKERIKCHNHRNRRKGVGNKS